MSEAKHTPGPWRVEEGTTVVWGKCNPDDNSLEGMGIQIAEAKQTHGIGVGAKYIDECDANARLIAAAPDLLDAATAMYAAREAFYSAGDLNGRLSAMKEEQVAMGLLRAAVRKAQGGGDD